MLNSLCVMLVLITIGVLLFLYFIDFIISLFKFILSSAVHAMTMCFLCIILSNALLLLSCYKNIFVLQNDILASFHPRFRGIFFFSGISTFVVQVSYTFTRGNVDKMWIKYPSCHCRIALKL